MSLSSQFLARLCWVIDNHLNNTPYHKKVLRECEEIEDILDSTLIMIQNVECALYTVSITNGKKITLVCFKSTDSVEDWKHNFDIRLRQYIDGVPRCGCICSSTPMMHNGYLTQYNIIKDKLHAYLQKHMDVDYTIITGFSLGGGMALILSYIANLKNTITVTFGNPRVGNRAFVNTFQKKPNILHCERWVFHKDPIPKFPLGIVYKHTPGLKHIVQNSDKIIEVEKCSFCTLLTSDKSDHNLMKYFEKIDTDSLIPITPVKHTPPSI